jgi:LmbE family N-acetylglucosaminyl deacetylase
MLGENQLIPYEAASIPPGPYLVFAPHPDDETFGMGGILIQAAQQGIVVHIAVMTDGALGGADEDLVAVRKAEVKQVADFLGAQSVHFFGFPDRGLCFSAQTIQTVMEHIQALKPSVLFFPSMLEYHPDHRTTTLIVSAAMKQLSEEPIEAYSYEISVPGFANRLIDITPVVEKKRKAMSLYLSQLEQNQYCDFVLALNRTRAYTLPDEISHAEGLYHYTQEERLDLLATLSKRVRRYFDDDALVDPSDEEIKRLKDELSCCEAALSAMKQSVAGRVFSLFRKIGRFLIVR